MLGRDYCLLLVDDAMENFVLVLLKDLAFEQVLDVRVEIILDEVMGWSLGEEMVRVAIGDFEDGGLWIDVLVVVSEIDVETGSGRVE